MDTPESGGVEAADKLITVFYGADPFQIERGTHTTEQLVAVFSVPQGYILDLIGGDAEFIELKPGATLQVKKGMRFISHAPIGKSS